MSGINEAVMPEFAAMYGFAEDDVRRSIVAVMERRIEPAEGSRRLFRAMARPTAFLETFHVRYREGTGLQIWLSSTGTALAESFERHRARIADLPSPDAATKHFVEGEIGRAAEEVATSFIQLARTDLSEVGLTKRDLIRAVADPETLARMPCHRTLAGYLPHFMSANLGMDGDGSGHRPERSAAGDIIHALYLPHADVWRGDRRFAHLLRQELPHLKSRIASRLSEVPRMVERWRGPGTGDDQPAASVAVGL